MKTFWCATALGIVLLGCSWRTREVDPRLKGAYQAARAIEGALEVGVTYGDFGTLIRELSKEIVLVRDRARYAHATPDASLMKVIQQYELLLLMYKDSSTVWKLQIEDKKYDEELAILAVKYGVSTSIQEWQKIAYDVTANDKGLRFDQVRQAIWSKATRLQEELAASIYGRFPQPQTQRAK